MTEWTKVITEPLGLVGFALFLVFGYLAKVKRNDVRRWLSPVSMGMAFVVLIGGLFLAYKGANRPASTIVHTSKQQVPMLQQTSQVQQTSVGPTGINIQGVQGDVAVTVHQDTGQKVVLVKKHENGHRALPVPQPQAGQAGSSVGTVVQGPCSNLQIGGVGNSSSINCAAQRRIPNQKISKLTELFSAYPGSSVSIRVRNADGITIQDANNLLMAFAKTGTWRYSGVHQLISGTDIGSDGMPIPELTGVHIYARAERMGLALSVKNALKVVGVDSAIEVRETVTGDDINILVGAPE